MRNSAMSTPGQSISTSKVSSMRHRLKSRLAGFALVLAITTGNARAAQAQQHEHPDTSPPAQQSPSGQMQDMDAMMTDPAMRQKMMAQMGQCRDMMSKMMKHMEHMEHGGPLDTIKPAQPNH